MTEQDVFLAGAAVGVIGTREGVVFLAVLIGLALLYLGRRDTDV